MNEAEKRTHAAVNYENPSTHGERACWRCEHYLGRMETDDGKPACEGVQRPIAPGGWCERFTDIFRELK
jgi:hypothetical protein